MAITYLQEGTAARHGRLVLDVYPRTRNETAWSLGGEELEEDDGKMVMIVLMEEGEVMGNGDTINGGNNGGRW